MSLYSDKQIKNEPKLNPRGYNGIIPLYINEELCRRNILSL